jgi:hypothetical protein
MNTSKSQRGEGGSAAPGTKNIHVVGAPTMSSGSRCEASTAVTVGLENGAAWSRK